MRIRSLLCLVCLVFACAAACNSSNGETAILSPVDAANSATDEDAAPAFDASSVPGIDLARPCKSRGLPSACDDGNPCTADTCHIASGFCQHQPVADTMLCDDGNGCTIGDKCASGSCKSGTQKVCDDGNPCTSDQCNPTGGACVFYPIQEGAPCDDGNPCTSKDSCKTGLCMSGPETQCDDGNGCTKDSCDKSKGGCVFQKLAEGACDDKDPCTTEKCADGTCVAHPILCEDGNPCTNDLCVSNFGCASVNGQNGSPCDDGNPCTSADGCSDGVCKSGQFKDCNDFNACTKDSCDVVSGQCVHSPSGLTTCDDNDKCTQDDVCAVADGKPVCKGKPLDCNDGNPCTSDQCDPSTGCTHPANNSPCDDGNKCTEKDTCNKGACAGSVINCDDDNPCTKDYCSPTLGCVSEYVDGMPCNDSNPCTKDDYCKAGSCAGGVFIICDDNNPCTSDSCNPASGCVFQKVSNGALCDDGNVCTSKETCQDGKCVGGSVITCDDGNPCTADKCDAKTGICTHSPLTDNTVCEDENKCTMGDSCQKGTCIGAVMQLCNDADTCTYDSCDPPTGKCVHTQIPDCKK